MSFDGALVTEQGVTFAIVCVKPYVLRSTDKENVREQFSLFFGFVPTILMAQNTRGIPTYDGRRDIVKFLSHVHPSRIPWRHYQSTI